MELVNQLLGYAYSVTGEVLHGRRIGRTLGMPTINILPEERKLRPAERRLRHTDMDCGRAV